MGQMKRILAALLCGVLLCAATSCNTQNRDAEQGIGEESTVQVTDEQTEEVLDGTVQESAQYYKIFAFQKGSVGSVTTSYAYEIYDKNGKVVLFEETDESLSISMLNDRTVEICIGGELGSRQYYDVEGNRFSERFSSVVAVSDELVAYVFDNSIDGRGLAVQNIFDRSDYSRAFGCTFSPSFGQPVLYAAFSEQDESLQITYYTERSALVTVTEVLPIRADSAENSGFLLTYWGNGDGSCRVSARGSEETYESVEIPAFSPCGELVTQISSLAFINREELCSVTLPRSIRTIGAYAFDHCESLQTICFGGSMSQWKMIEGIEQIGSDVEVICAETADFSSYDSILRLWRDVTAYCASRTADADADTGVFDSAVTDETERGWLDTLIAAADAHASHDLLSYGYALKDIDGDGTDELILFYGRTVLSVFSMHDGKPSLTELTADSETTWQTGLTVLPLRSLSDRTVAAEMFGAVLRNEAPIYDTDALNEGLHLLKDAQTPYMRRSLKDEALLLSYALLDMDGDGQMELAVDTLDGVLVLRYYDGQICSYAFTFRQMYRIMADGSFSWNHSGTDFEYGGSRLYFEGAEAKTRQLWRIVNDGTLEVAYYIGDEQVTQEQIKAYFAETYQDEQVLLPIARSFYVSDGESDDGMIGK